MKRILGPLLAALFALLGPLAAGAQPFPSKPVRIVVGFPPAGAADATIRIVAQGLSAQLGQSVLVENRPGAENVIAAETVLKSPPDGHTLFMGSNTAMVAVPSARAKPPYDPFADFTPVSRLGSFTMFLVVSPKMPVNSVAQFVDHVRANPGKFNYASSNSAAYLAAVQLLAPSKLQMTHVPYKGDAPALTDLMTDRIQMMFSTGTGVPPLVKDGRVRALATLLPSRSPLLPDVPTGAEAGLQRLTIDAWAAIFGPARMPADITARLSREVNAALQRSEVREQLERQGFAGIGSSPQQLAAFHKAQYESWTRTVREYGIKFE
jgi:tripartite-type tricarboxylate transporter receptor subunit TctC